MLKGGHKNYFMGAYNFLQILKWESVIYILKGVIIIKTSGSLPSDTPFTLTYALQLYINCMHFVQLAL